MARKKIDIPEQELREAVSQGESLEDIAALYGCSVATVESRIKEYGIGGNMSDVVKGLGLDIGTMNVVSARKVGDQIVTKRIRDAFLDLEPEAKKMLKLSGVSFIEYEDRILILGDAALETANLFKREARRPLSKGLISSGEVDALEVLSILIENVIGKPSVPDEVCYYSIPAAPMDMPGQDVVYHEAVFAKILTELGYQPVSGNEAMAIIYSECAKEGFSGIALSFGSGMVNCALSYKTMPIMEFSLARCLAEDFPVDTPNGMVPISQIKVGDLVLGEDGKYTEVVSVHDNGCRDEVVEICVEGMPFSKLRMTDDHLIRIRQGSRWEWVEAGRVTEGDIVGTPIISYSGNHSSYYFCREESQNITVTKSRNLGRFIGCFLGDGSTLLYTSSSGGDGGRVHLDFNRKDQALVQKYSDVISDLFGRFPIKVSRHTQQLDRLVLEYNKIASHLKSKCYSENKEKILPLPLHDIPDQMALGIIEGLLDSDGAEHDSGYSFCNTSVPLIKAVHHLLNRFGIWHTISKRGPREGGLNHKGVRITGTKDSWEVSIRDSIAVAQLKALIEKEGHSIRKPSGAFMERKISSIRRVPYGSTVYDISVATPEHSFASWGLVVHNCGDWIDENAAKAVGTTASRMCAIKEKGVDLTAPKTREEEALVVYYKSLIKYSLDNIAKKFKMTQGDTELQDAIPIVVSGGTSLPVGFLDVFKEVFETQRKKFPIEISDIRHADNPMTAVAQGLLVQARAEYDE